MATDDRELGYGCSNVGRRIRNRVPHNGIGYVGHCDDCQVSAHVPGHQESLYANCGTSAAMLDSSKFCMVEALNRLATVKVANVKSRPVLRWHCAIDKTQLFITYHTSPQGCLSVLIASSSASTCDPLPGPSAGLVRQGYARGDIIGLKDASIAAALARMLGYQVSASSSGGYRGTPLLE